MNPMPGTSVQFIAPSDTYAAITPSDSTSFTQGVTRGIFVGGAGNLVAVQADGTAVTFTGVVAGAVYPIRCKRVNSTNTTATNMVALF